MLVYLMFLITFLSLKQSGICCIKDLLFVSENAYHCFSESDVIDNRFSDDFDQVDWAKWMAQFGTNLDTCIV
jgi:hypothetical protein